jgi:hypothetical protein
MSYDKCDMYVIDNVTEYREYHIPDNATARTPCNSWVYDKSVYDSTRIEQVRTGRRIAQFIAVT